MSIRLFSFLSSVSDSDISVKILELVLRSAASDADALELIAPVHELSILALTRRRHRRQIAHSEIRIDAAIKGLHPRIRVEVRLEIDVHRAVERAEIGVPLRIPGERDRHFAVQRIHPAGSADLIHLYAAIDVLNI